MVSEKRPTFTATLDALASGLYGCGCALTLLVTIPLVVILLWLLFLRG